MLTGTEIVPSRLERYGELLSAEADQQQALVAAAYAARRDMSIFRDLSFLYFACVSFEEIRQRLLDVGADSAEADGTGSVDAKGVFTVTMSASLVYAGFDVTYTQTFETLKGD